MLDEGYITECEFRARRFSGAYTGTSGTLAADVIRLLDERQTLMTTVHSLESANAGLRAAVAGRMAATDPSDPKMQGYVSPTEIADSDTPVIPDDWILQGHRELQQQRLRGDCLLSAQADEVSPSERMLLDAAAAVRDRRLKYGPPRDHFAITVALINAAFGTAFRPEDWATMMMLDKIARSRGPGDHPDNDIDGAGYAACRAECRAP